LGRAQETRAPLDWLRLSAGLGKQGGQEVGRIAQNPCAIGIGGFPREWEAVGSPPSPAR